MNSVILRFLVIAPLRWPQPITVVCFRVRKRGYHFSEPLTVSQCLVTAPILAASGPPALHMLVLLSHDKLPKVNEPTYFKLMFDSSKFK